MRLAKNRSLIAGILQKLGKRLLIPIERIPIVHKAVLMAVLPGLNHRAAGPADGVGAEAVFENHSLRRDLVDVWRGVHRLEPTVVSANRVRCVVVCEDE